MKHKFLFESEDPLMREKHLADNCEKEAEQIVRYPHTKEDKTQLMAEYFNLSEQAQEKARQFAVVSETHKTEMKRLNAAMQEKMARVQVGHDAHKEKVYLFASDTVGMVDVYNRFGHLIDTRPFTMEEKQMNLFKPAVIRKVGGTE